MEGVGHPEEAKGRVREGELLEKNKRGEDSVKLLYNPEGMKERV